MGIVNYRAVHTKSLWRKVNSHQSMESAIYGKDGAAGLFARKARINYETHGDPCYVIVWEQGAQSGFVVRQDTGAPSGIRQATIPIDDIRTFESSGQASKVDLEKYF
jgi:hypothetical protein